MKLCGIYCIMHIATGRKYVGQSINIKRRWNHHANAKANTYLSRSISMYGWGAFTTEILEICDKQSLNDAEARWISVHNCISPHGFNLTSGGELREPNKETRAKMAASKIGHVMPSKTREAIATANKGRKHSPESKAAASHALIGRKFSDETRMKMAISAKARFDAGNGAILLAIHKGRKQSAEEKANRVASIKATKAKNKLLPLIAK